MTTSPDTSRAMNIPRYEFHDLTTQLSAFHTIPRHMTITTDMNDKYPKNIREKGKNTTKKHQGMVLGFAAMDFFQDQSGSCGYGFDKGHQGKG